MPKVLRKYVNDYRINLFEIAYLSDEQVKMFKSDFKCVADFFVQKRKNADYVPSKEVLDHASPVIELLSAMTGDQKFAETRNEIKEGDRYSMCEIFERNRNMGVKEGIEKGVAKMIVAMNQRSFSIEEIADCAELSVEEVKQILGSDSNSNFLKK